MRRRWSRRKSCRQAIDNPIATPEKKSGKENLALCNPVQISGNKAESRWRPIPKIIKPMMRQALAVLPSCSLRAIHAAATQARPDRRHT